jgi:hypothetical protein
LFLELEEQATAEGDPSLAAERDLAPQGGVRRAELA